MVMIELVRVMVGKVIVKCQASHRSSSVICSLVMWINSNHFLSPSVQKKWTLRKGIWSMLR